MQKKEFTILMPCLNEKNTIIDCIKDAEKSITRLKLNAEILVVDNGSDDGSYELALSTNARVIREPQKGYGAALWAGILESGGEYIIMADCDRSYDLTQIDDFVKYLRQGFQLVVGDRFKGGIEPKAMPFLHRYIGNPILSWMGRTINHCNVRDFQCGLRGFDKKAIKSLNLTRKDMVFANEMIIKACRAGYKIKNIPIILYKDGRNHKSHLNTIRDGFSTMLFLIHSQ